MKQDRVINRAATSNKMTSKIDPKEITPLFKAYPFIAAAYQFGSTVRGQEGPLSDLDIAILVDEERAPGDPDLLRLELLLAYDDREKIRHPGGRPHHS